MRAVGVRDLRANLSRYLREVERGETVLVTDRGRVVAELRPESAADRSLRQLAAHTTLIVRGPHDPSVYVPSPLRAPAGTALALLDAERSLAP